MDLIAAGTVTTGNTVTITDRSARWCIVATTAVQITVKFGTNGPTVTIPSTVNFPIDFEGNYQSITVNGGTAAYWVYG